MSDAIAKASDLLRGRINEIDAERRQLEQALSRLVGATASRVAARPRRQSSSRVQSASRRPTRGRRRRVASRGERQRQLVAHLEVRPGSRPSEIAKALGVSSANVQNILRKARTDGVVVKRDGGYALSGKSPTASGRAQTAPATSNRRTGRRTQSSGDKAPAEAK